MGLREDRLGRISTHWRTCGCTRGDSAETCGMSRSGFCSTSPVEWNHLQAPLQAHRANRWSSEYQRRTWRAGVGVGHRATSPACPPAPGQEKVRGSSASAWAGDSPTCPSMPLQSKLRAAARCERKLCPLGTSHWRIPKRLGNGEKGALSGSLVKEPQPEHDLNQWPPRNILQRHLLTKV